MKPEANPQHTQTKHESMAVLF